MNQNQNQTWFHCGDHKELHDTTLYFVGVAVSRPLSQRELQYVSKNLNVTMGQLYGHLKSASYSAIGKLSWGRFAQLLSNCNPNKRKLVPDSVNRNYYTPWEFGGCTNKKKAISALKWRSFYRLILVWNGYIVDRYRRNVGIDFWGGHVVLVGRQITISVTTDRRYHYTKYPNTDFRIAGWGGRTGPGPPVTAWDPGRSSLTSTRGDLNHVHKLNRFPTPPHRNYHL